MEFAGKLRIRGKIMAALSGLALLVVLVGLISLAKMAGMNAAAHRVAFQAAPSVQFTSTMRFDMSGYRRSELAHILSTYEAGYTTSTEEAGFGKYEKLMAQYDSELQEQEKKFEAVIKSEQERQLLKDFTNEWNAYLARSKQVIAMSRDHQQAEAARFIQGETRVQYGRADEVLTKLVDLEEKQAQQAAVDCDWSYGSAKLWMLLAMLAAAGGTIILARRIAARITEPLNRLVQVAQQIGESGNLQHDIDIHRGDEIGDLARSFSRMISYLKEMAATSEYIADGDLCHEVTPRSKGDVLGHAFAHMTEALAALVRNVRDSASQVAGAASQIADASEQSAKISVQAAAAIDEVSSTMQEMSSNTQNVVKHTQLQAASVSDTSSSIEQMVASNQRVADTSKFLLEISSRSREEVQNGITSMDQTTDGMGRINSSINSSSAIINTLEQRANNIGAIVEVIDDLAEQSNLLALNAAIEAARAGEHGLGFAVVADEVRKLAEKSAQSTKEISELIRSIQQEARNAVSNMGKSTAIVNEGQVLGSQLSAALQKISNVVGEVYKFAQEIGTATDEQSKGSSQIAKATSRLNGITHEIASSVEEQASGTRAVVQAMEHMRDLVQQSTSSSTELAAASEQMSRMSRALLNGIDRFRLHGAYGNEGSEVVRHAVV